MDISHGAYLTPLWRQCDRWVNIPLLMTATITLQYHPRSHCQPTYNYIENKTQLLYYIVMDCIALVLPILSSFKAAHYKPASLLRNYSRLRPWHGHRCRDRTLTRLVSVSSAAIMFSGLIPLDKAYFSWRSRRFTFASWDLMRASSATKWASSLSTSTAWNRKQCRQTRLENSKLGQHTVN